ncbi:MAG: ABC transporter substrate-binding protein [Chitinophagales bacterium]
MKKEIVQKISRFQSLGLIAAMIFLSVVIAGCGESTSNSNSLNTKKDVSQNPIKIGAVLDISGSGSSLGIPARDSIKMWEKQVNSSGGINGRPVKVIILDNGSDETKAVLAFKKLVNEEKVVAVAGASQSGTTIAMINSATQQKVPLVSAAASIKIITPPGERNWIFKTAQNDSVVASRIIDYLKEKKIKKVGFMSLNNAYGDSGLQEFSQVAKAAGIQIAQSEKFGATDVDFTAQLTNINKKKPEAVVVWAIPPSAALLTKQYRDLGLTMPLIHSHGIANQTFISLAGNAANGVIFPAGKLLVAESLPDTDSQKAGLIKYIEGYEKPNRPRSAFGGHGYDAISLIGKAIEKAGTDPAKIRNELEKMTTPGISGVFKMSPSDHCGIDKSSLVLIEIQDGKWAILEK